MHSSTGIQIVVLSVALLSVTLYVEAGNVQLDYSVTDESRSCANPGEQVTFTCMTTGGVLIFTSALFSSNPITFVSIDNVLRTVIRSVGASTFTATLTEVDGSDLTATLTVVASEEVTGTIGCTDNVNPQEANLCLTAPQLVVVPENQLVPFNLGENVTFQCEVEDGEVVWEVNNIQLLTPQLRMQGEQENIFVVDLVPMGRRERSELLVTVEEGDDHNNTLVRCIGVDAASNTNASGQVRIITFAIPETPRNLQVTLMRENFLFLTWDPPSNLPPGVDTTYDVTVVNPDNGMVYPGFPMNNIAMTFVEFEEVDTSCQLYEFIVTAENSAGSSDPAVIRETVPISTNVTSVSDSLMAIVSFSGIEVLISLIFNRAIACSTRFGVNFHNISLNGEIVMQILDQDSGPIMVTLRSNEISALLPDTEYSITVTACSSLTCRQAEPTTAVTTDVQSASVTFVDTDVLLSCELAEGSPALGCVFIFSLNNDTERFIVSRSDTVGSQRRRQMDTQAEVCQTTLNLLDAYDSVVVVDWESDGSEGTLPMTVVPQEDPDSNTFVCPPPTPTATDSGSSVTTVSVTTVSVTTDSGSNVTTDSKSKVALGLVVGLPVGLVVVLVVIVAIVIILYRINKKSGAAPTTPTPLLEMKPQNRIGSDGKEDEEKEIKEKPGKWRSTTHGTTGDILEVLKKAIQNSDVGSFRQHLAELEKLLHNTLGEQLTANGALGYAAKVGSIPMMDTLIKKGVDVNAVSDVEIEGISYLGRTPLHLAAVHGNLDTVKYLVDHGADVHIKDNRGWAPLHWAAHHGNLAAVKCLVDCGADVNITNNDGSTPLHWAAVKGNLHAVKYLVDCRADINIKDNDGSTPLHLAATEGNVDTVKYLVGHGADVNIRNGDGESPLHEAAASGNLDTVKYLVDRGADVNIKDNDGDTPLHEAAIRGNLDAVRYLVDHEAYVNIKNNGGRTPLYEAAIRGNLDAVKYLVDHGAEINIKDNHGETPLRKAAASDHHDVVKYLVDLGADVKMSGIRSESLTSATSATSATSGTSLLPSIPPRNIKRVWVETKGYEYGDSEKSEKTSATRELPFSETNPQSEETSAPMPEMKPFFPSEETSATCELPLLATEPWMEKTTDTDLFLEVKPQPPTIRKRYPVSHQSEPTSVQGATEAGEGKDKDE